MTEIESWVQQARAHGITWDTILLARQENVEQLSDFLKAQHDNNFWPAITVEEWQHTVNMLKQDEDARNAVIDANGATIITDAQHEINEIEIPLDPQSAWQCYRRTLMRNGFSKIVVDTIEDATHRTLKRLSRDTRNLSEPIKGLVVGNVQSGKTANMTALMAMAADNGWNMFVVLSGMMENLRNQNQKRMWKDLRSPHSRLDWQIIDNPRPVEACGRRLADLKLAPTDTMRYIAVCLKNKTRLKNIIDWLAYNDASRSNVRMLVIDDEADQASINTSQDVRSQINRLILNLINNRNSRSSNVPTAIQSVNYIGYTATPYANVLNEAPGPESLYPSNFISVLSSSNEYFGPQQIFGFQGGAASSVYFPGLDIVRDVTTSEEEMIADIQEAGGSMLPQSLKDAVCWFINGVGYMRYIGYKKPVTMLVHTSRKVEHHGKLASAIQRWMGAQSRVSLIAMCRTLWDAETARFTLANFNASYPGYGAQPGRDYPAFADILPYINDLLTAGLSKILIDKNNPIPQYSTGIHLCVDNSDLTDAEADSIKRLVYPEDEALPCDAPAFIVVGGNTLSRGLTLEGLLSTFFIRPARCADTLMQMGRWFGYRRGYELIPRIWMTDHTRSAFVDIAELDQKLRDEIKDMERQGLTPTDCGPKIMSSSTYVRLVAANKMQAAAAADFDFAGSTVATVVFNNDLHQLQDNLSLTVNFLKKLGNAATDVAQNPRAAHKMVWKGVDFKQIKKFMKNFHYSERLRVFEQIDELLGWLDKATAEGIYGNWNVILAGLKPTAATSSWTVPGTSISVEKVHHSLKYVDPSGKILNIGTLRSPDDLFADIAVNSSSDPVLTRITQAGHDTKKINELRDSLGMGSTPQLIIYIVDKDSKLPTDHERDLNAKADLAGFAVNIPGVKAGRNSVYTVRIKLR